MNSWPLLVLAWARLGVGAPPPVVAEAPPPYKVERFVFPGPVAGVVVRIDLKDPRVQVQAALTDDRDPDGPGPCVGQLDTPSSAARKHDFAITINAGYFAVPATRKLRGDSISYFIGNGAIPEGWHFSGGRVVTRPAKDALRDAFIVHLDGTCSFQEGARELPDDTRYAVSGSAMVLKAGRVVARPGATARHPRSALGLDADGRSLMIVAVDGRQDHSRGVTLDELGKLMKELGAHQALNLDGGGSTALVIKDPATGVFTLANRPSETSTTLPQVQVERPVADVIGVRIR
jgi:hypothetical protein